MMIYMKKLCTSDWLRTSAFFMQHKSKVVTQVQIINSKQLKLWISACKFFRDCTCTNCSYLMHSYNYVVFDKFTCVCKTPNCIEKLLPEHDFFKILYGLCATAWISIAKISYCGLWTMSVNINFRIIFSGFLKLLAIGSLWTFCSISLHHNLSLCILWCFLPKTAVDSLSFRQSGSQWLFQWTYLVIITCFVSTDHQRHATSTYTDCIYFLWTPVR